MRGRPGCIALVLALLAAAASIRAEESITVGPPRGPRLAIVDEGRVAATIVLPAAPAPLEKFAASELARFLAEMTGATLPVVGEDRSPTGPLVHIGRTAAVKGSRIVDAEATGDEGFVIYGDPDEHAVFISGSQERGTLWGVYTFLQKAGCRWPLPDPLWRSVPKATSVYVGRIRETSRPDFPVRGYHYRGADALWEWMAFNRMNYHLQDPPAYEAAGRMAAYGLRAMFAAHSFAYWVPPSVLEEYPEWAALIGGRRRLPPAQQYPVVNTQLCTSNPELVKYVTARVLSYMEGHAEVGIVSLEPNDGGGVCECGVCVAQSPDWSTRLVLFANAVAEAVARHYPDRKIALLAYNNHIDPPWVRPLPNTEIGFCPYREIGETMDSPANAEYLARLKGWKAMDIRPWVYEYFFRTTWPGYLTPWAHVLGHDIQKVYGPLGARGVIPEAMTLPTLRSMICANYVLMRLLWDRSLDVDEQIRDLCDHMYGVAAAPMYDYYQALERQAAGSFRAGTVGDLARFIPPVAEACRRHLDRALAAAREEGRPVLARVEQERELFDRTVRAAQGWVPARALSIPKAIRSANKAGNPSFETARMEPWATDVRGGDIEFAFDESIAFHGRRSARIHAAAPGWGRYYQTVQGLDPEKRYVISLAVRTKDLKGDGQIWLVNGSRPWPDVYAFGPAEGEWMRFTIRDYPAPKGSITVYLTSKGSSGDIYFDDVAICDEDHWAGVGKPPGLGLVP